MVPNLMAEKYSKNFFFGTTWLRYLRFSMKYGLVVIYQICSNDGARIQNGLTLGDPWFEPKKYIEKFSKIFFFKATWPRCLKFAI